MAPASESLPEVDPRLVKAGASGHLVVLVGAGASVDAGLPLWSQLLEILRARARSSELTPQQQRELSEAQAWFDADSTSDLDKKAYRLSQIMGREWLASALCAELRSRSRGPGPVHHALAGLPGATFITTNYDVLLEQALFERSNTVPRVVLPTDVDGVFGLAVGEVLKLHGDLSDPKTIVLTKEDYFRVSQLTPEAWKRRLQAMMQRPFELLLVGYSYRDNDVESVVDTLRGAYEDRLPGPFWLELKSQPALATAGAARLRPIWIADHHDAVPWLQELSRRIAAETKSASVVHQIVFAEKLGTRLEDDKAAAGRLFQNGDYERAKEAYEKLLTDAAAVSHASDSDIFLRLVASSKTNIAACSLCLQQNDDARLLFLDVADRHLEYLSLSGRAILAEGLAQVGERQRARAVLEATSLGDDDGQRIAEAYQLLEALDGRLGQLPDNLSPIVGLAVARSLLAQERLTEAWRRAQATIESAPEDELVQLYCVDVIERALAATIFENAGSPAQWIPVSDRVEVVRTLESRLESLHARLHAVAHQRHWREIALRFYQLTDDSERARAIAETTEAADPCEGAEASDAVRSAQARRLAAEGKLTEAKALLPRLAHPWYVAWQEVVLHDLAGDFDAALRRALELVELFPGRVPLELSAAELLLREPRPDEALAHAQAAFEGLPGRGQRLLLGHCLIATGQHTQAAGLLQQLADSRSADTLRVLAHAFEVTNQRRAVELWQEYLASCPDDLRARLRLTQLLFNLGRSSEAKESAWHLFESARDQLDAPALYTCAVFQQLAGTFDEEAKERVRRIATALERFGTPEAEGHRLMLLAAVDFPEEARAVDYEQLARAGVLKAVPIDEAAEAMRARRDLNRAVFEAYRLGHLPFESLCRLTQTPAADWVSRLAELAEDAGIPGLSAPAGVGDELVQSLQSRRLLVSQLEVLLLQHLGLLHQLPDALGPTGKLVLFSDVWDEMRKGETELRVQDVTLDKQKKLLRALRETQKIACAQGDDHAPEEEWAASSALPIVNHEAPPGAVRLSPRAVAMRLRRAGAVTDACADQLLRALPVEAEATELPASLPDRVAIGLVPLEAFFQSGALNALLDLVPERLVVPPATLRMVQDRCHQLNQAHVAAKLAREAREAIGSGINAGWVATLARPQVPDLPEVRDEEHRERIRELCREPLELGMSYRQALLDDQYLWLLTADYFVTGPLGTHIDLITKLAWPNPQAQAYLRFANRLSESRDRELHVPQLLDVEPLVPDPDRARKRQKLSRLGFVDALRGRDLLEMSRQYETTGLAGAEPSRILDRMEWMARERDASGRTLIQHAGAPLARMRIAAVYADAIWQAFQQSKADATARGISDVLLTRADGLGVPVLQRTIAFLLLQAAQHPSRSVAPSPDDEDMFIPSLDSPGGRVWQYLAGSLSENSHKSSATSRAIREVCLFVDSQFGPDRITAVMCAPLILAVETARSSVVEPALEALAILSGNWTYRPLQVLNPVSSEATDPPSLEQEMEHLASDLADTASAMVANDRVIWHRQRQDSGAPVEAILLRAKPNAAVGLAKFLARHQGPHDGRAHDLLARLAENPDDSATRRQYARMTVVAPWRLVREQPGVLGSWASNRYLSDVAFPRTINDLRVMLSEPPTGLSSENVEMFEILQARLGPNGSWADRYDRDELLRQVTEVPGSLPASILQMRLQGKDTKYDEEIAGALARLGNSDSYPAARLAGDVLFLRLAASRRPYARVSGSEVDLREVLSETFAQLLRTIVSRSDEAAPAREGDGLHAPAPGGHSFATDEPRILRVCGKVVRDLAGPQPLPFREGLWLTYRLYQWLCAQLDSLAPGTRSAALEELAALAGPAEALAPGSDDLLNPFGFGAGPFDYRLATVLHAIAMMEEMLAFLSDEQNPGPAEPPRPVTSTAIEGLLEGIAARPITDAERRLRARGDTLSCLGWRGPGTVPDLALTALFSLNRRAFFRLPMEARHRCIVELPNRPDDRERMPWSLGVRLIQTLTVHAGQMSVEERVALEERLRALVGGSEDDTEVLRWLGLTQLFASGQAHLESECRALLLARLDHSLAPAAFGAFLGGTSRSGFAHFEQETEHLFAEIEAAGVDPVPFASGLAGLTLRRTDTIPIVHQILRNLATRPPYAGDSRMAELLDSLGVE